MGRKRHDSKPAACAVADDHRFFATAVKNAAGRDIAVYTRTRFPKSIALAERRLPLPVRGPEERLSTFAVRTEVRRLVCARIGTEVELGNGSRVAAELGKKRQLGLG